MATYDLSQDEITSGTITAVYRKEDTGWEKLGSVTPPTPPEPANIYEQISAAADAGTAQELYPVGTMIDVDMGVIVTTEISDHLTMRIIGYNGIIQEDDGTQKQNRPQLLAVRLLAEDQAFDAGNSVRWGGASIRTWLNDTYLNTLPDSFKNAVKTSIVTTCPYGSTVPYTTLDKLWLLSYTEAGGVTSGTQYVDGVKSAYITNSDRRIGYRPNGSTSPWFLRSVNQEKNRVWAILSAGQFNYYEPTSKWGPRPACNL